MVSESMSATIPVWHTNTARPRMIMTPTPLCAPRFALDQVISPVAMGGFGFFRVFHKPALPTFLPFAVKNKSGFEGEMCYSIEWSASFAAIGLISLPFWKLPERVIIAFYTGMEILQTLQYQFNLSDCASVINPFLTIVALLFVVCQPALWNWYRLKHSTSRNRAVFQAFFLAGVTWALSYVGRVVYARWVPPEVGCVGKEEMNIVGSQFCTLAGPKHLYWVFPAAAWGGVEPNYWAYLLIWFLPALWEDHWPRLKLFFWLLQVSLVAWFTPFLHERNSVWCLWSIPIFLLFGLL